MRGLIQKRGSESWRIRAYVGRDANGTKRYVSKTVRGTRKDAERDLSRLLVEVDEGRHAAAAPLTATKALAMSRITTRDGAVRLSGLDPVAHGGCVGGSLARSGEGAAALSETYHRGEWQEASCGSTAPGGGARARCTHHIVGVPGSQRVFGHPSLSTVAMSAAAGAAAR